MPSIDQILPASVVAAVCLFITKEALESWRRAKTKKSKKRAMAHVIGSELKDNFDALDDFYKVIEFFSCHKDEECKLQFIRLHHGYESCVIDTDKSHLQMTMPVFKTVWYEELLMDLAERDEDIRTTVSTAYDTIYFLIEKRNLLASLMAGELNSFLKLSAVTTIDMLLHSRDAYESNLIAAYRAVTGKEKIHP